MTNKQTDRALGGARRGSRGSDLGENPRVSFPLPFPPTTCATIPQGGGGDVRGRLPRLPPPQAPPDPVPSDAPAALPVCFTDRWVSLYNADDDALADVPLTCGRWDCPDCADRKRTRIVAQVLAGRPDKVLTLTTRPDDSISLHHACCRLRRAFRQLRDLIVAEFGYFEYAAALELTRKGAPHLHVTARCPYIPHPWLSEHWHSLTGAYVVYIEKVKDPAHEARHLAKYVAKSCAAVAGQHTGIRPFTYSKGWLPPDFNRPRTNDQHWQIVSTYRLNPAKRRDVLRRLNCYTEPCEQLRFGQVIRCHGPPDPDELGQLLEFGSRGQRLLAGLIAEMFSPPDGPRAPACDIRDHVDYISDPRPLL